ncbi:hypothetical protein LHYA1_G007571 [Lachnellula hyalina]|uniref:Uncharacterized protein n=1 Tax=Lachnellula hyalina TaxID=1316788 RepID=A0A8H8TVG4_9HELO|nr:uncharacterized protein LHYA1_G007571 [Lachnellula hyalina]TVY23814.1 hypothetical protein LHYA1_G007571 [Lachnellula hyalina]
MNMFYYPLLSALAVCSFALPSLGATGCPTGLSLCSPPGATNSHTPQIGSPDFENLYTDLLHSPLPLSTRSGAEDGTASLCCITSLSCLAMPTLALPFCYDKFTTNFFLQDTSFGTLSLGTYTSRLGDFANFKTGDYTLTNGTKGNIYSDNPSAKPNTSTLAIPTQFTASGVGPVIPASALGGEVTITYVTTLPGSTVPATTIPPSTHSESVATQTILFPETVTTTISGTATQSKVAKTSFELSTSSATTIEGTTIKGTTLPGAVTTVTTTTKVATSSSDVGTTASASSKKSTAIRLSIESLSISSIFVVALAFLIDF